MSKARDAAPQARPVKTGNTKRSAPRLSKTVLSAKPDSLMTAPVKSASPARVAAFEVLLRVGAGKGHCDELLQGHLLQGLSQEDRNLATALVMGVLRWQIALDARVAPFLSRPSQKLAEPVAIALRLGVFQLLHLDRVPVHAAISESVELCRMAEQPHATGMVNAVLRKVAVSATSVPEPSSANLSIAQLALKYAHPLWLVERWIESYGRASTEAICAADQMQPPAAIRIVTNDVTHEAMLAQDGLEPGRLLGPARIGAAGNVAGLVANHPASCMAMDEGSQLVAELAALGVPDGGKILDCCAAPGGKTLILAERNPTATIVAADSSQRRLDEMRHRLERVPYAQGISFVRADAGIATVDGPLDGLFDMILCDVPCSGTGTLARNPEIRHRLKPENLRLFAERQKTILRASMERLAPGGRLVYSTCSLEQEENEDVVTACLIAGFRLVDASEGLAVLRDSGILHADAADMLMKTAVRKGYLRTLQGMHPCDGFFAAFIERLRV